MKKLSGVIVVLLLASSPVAAAAMRLELKASYFYPTEQTMLDIYGGGPSGGAEIDIRLWKGLDLWLGGSFFSKEGELTFTKEKTKLQLRPLGAGLKFRWTKGTVRLYTAAGLSAFQYKESNPLGEFNTTRLGLMGELGGYVKIAGGLSLDLFVNYSLSNIEGPDFAVDVAGVGAGLGLAYQF